MVGDDENTTFSRCLMGFPRFCHGCERKFMVKTNLGKCIISSKSRTLYAIFQTTETLYNILCNIEDPHFDDYPIGFIYTMDDLEMDGGEYIA